MVWLGKKRMTSLYGQYIKEREDLEILENSHSYVTYKISENELFVYDFFVVKEYRRHGEGKELCRKLEEMARKAGCTYAKTTVSLGVNGVTEALRFQLDYGMKVLSANQDYIVLGKEL